MTRVRVHQHVNPLAKYYLELPIKPVDLAEIFADPTLPLHLDIGCGRGRFLFEMAETDKKQNFLGVEIREPLIIEANKIRDTKNLKNLNYEFCNATFDLDVLLKNLPKDILRFVTIQFPDPWFKKKHAKRRMVKDKLVETLARRLAKNGKVFIQTDIEFLAAEMEGVFAQGKFRKDKIVENPLPVKTEREKSVENRSLSVYRAMYHLT